MISDRERLLVLRYSSHQRDDDIRRLYIKLRPYQLQKSKYRTSRSCPNGHCVIINKLVLKTFDKWKPPYTKILVPSMLILKL